MGSSASPTTPIWKKWSITHILAKPASSAVLAISANFGPIEAGASGQVKRGTCNPMRKSEASILSRDGSITSLPIVPTNRNVLRPFTSMQYCQHPVGLGFYTLIAEGVVYLELVRTRVPLIIRHGLWHHKSYARGAEIR